MTNKIIEQDDDEVMQLVHQAEAGMDDDGVVTFSSGVKVETKPIPTGIAMAFQKMWSAKRPHVPRVWIDELNDYEENPDNEQYQLDMDAWKNDFHVAQFQLSATLGVGNIINIPKGIPAPEDDSWLETYKMLGLAVPRTPAERKLAWINTHAIVTAGDMLALQLAVVKQTEVSEEEVTQQVEKFRSNSQRRGNSKRSRAR